MEMIPYNFNYENFTYTHNSLSLKNFSLSINSKSLFEDTSLVLSYGQRYGLIGKNGYGKSSLLKNLCLDNEKIRVLYVEQELILDNRTPVQYILDSNIKLKYYQDRVNLLYEQLENDQEVFDELQEAETNLASFNPDKEEALIKRILHGLGFDSEMLEKETNLFSGGWQMRISLARSLYLEPDLLLLDEPTNHLDLEAIIWLSDYLQNWKKIAIIVSHNIGFLNNTCSYILNIENKKLVSYKGNYYKFKSALKTKLAEIKKDYDNYEKKLKDIKKKGLTKKQLEEFIKKNQKPRPEKDYLVNMEFFSTKKFSSNIVRCENVSFSYGKSTTFSPKTQDLVKFNGDNKILDDVSFGLSMDSRVTLVGLNGSGKSTIIKLIMGQINPDSGYVNIRDGVRVGYYSQHFDQHLPFDKTPIEFLTDLYPNEELEENKLKEEIIRGYLGKINLESSAHTKLISELSGGQKARVAFVKLIFEKPHILLLDEPTNHLDIETVEALIDCLETFDGGIMLITHEPEMIERLSSQIWYLDMNKKKIDFRINSYDEYCNLVLTL
jgi:ATP-binding cassette, subfamily F, member 1